MKKDAFTLLELVFVIVVIGIITAVMLPRIDRDNIYEASQQLITHIKYTQHLAMIDDKYDDADADWYKKMWRIGFEDCDGGTKHSYTIFADDDKDGNADNDEQALDPLSHKYLDAPNCNAGVNQDPNVVLSDKFHIEKVVLEGPCFATNKYIAFDNLGRPHVDLAGPNNIAHDECKIILYSNDDNATITVEQETGYARLTAITP